ncbi:hypothetical protein, variant 1 [Aphanomyces invadans]|uniref:Tetraspanin n=1 Tax=Aphanomyces invadans TaxID=157072 RepID=A0A024UID7_9STRA|nr:hypothetical protein, variant 1 [Aphanomyces invadans]ETW05920.1 hypothetical protein, variant 1 [Aphanomyces invadans]|eukprot:XP_008865697.1 hypothetical protein, variant 1 [Aphanomyces invadans]
MLPNGGGGNRPSASRSTMTRRSEFDFSPHEKPSPFLGVVKVVIMLVNVAFMMVAGMLIYFTAWIQSLGLVAMFGSNYSWLSTAMFGVVLAFGVLVITTSLVGCLGAWAKNRHMLLGYMFVQTINLVVFVVIAVGGFLTRRMAHSLQASATPRHEEASFPMHFNPLYCQSQVAYYCSAGSVSESLTLFLGPSVAAKARGVFDQLYGWDIACNSSLIRITDTDLSRQVNATCALCGKYPAAKYSEFLTTIVGTCPLTPDTAKWCGVYLTTVNTSFSNVSSTPYGACRAQVLDLWVHLSSWVGFGAVGVALFSYETAPMFNTT